MSARERLADALAQPPGRLAEYLWRTNSDLWEERHRQMRRKWWSTACDELQARLARDSYRALYEAATR